MGELAVFHKGVLMGLETSQSLGKCLLLLFLSMSTFLIHKVPADMAWHDRAYSSSPIANPKHDSNIVLPYCLIPPEAQLLFPKGTRILSLGPWFARNLELDIPRRCHGKMGSISLGSRAPASNVCTAPKPHSPEPVVRKAEDWSSRTTEKEAMLQ
ncbi:hypothetical protein FRC02_003382 [Tulasnella sp. 418]|nr:hypothetical protein FRC02_003382 [Tulasnella sp. 418]